MDLNKCFFIGKVEETPQISEQNDRKQAFFNLIVNDRVQGANGQWVDKPMKTPIFAFNSKFKKTADLVEQNIVAGQELTIECKHQSWMAEDKIQHYAFILQQVSFGFKPRNTSDAPAGSAVAGPTG